VIVWLNATGVLMNCEAYGPIACQFHIIL